MAHDEGGDVELFNHVRHGEGLAASRHAEQHAPFWPFSIEKSILQLLWPVSAGSNSAESKPLDIGAQFLQGSTVQRFREIKRVTLRQVDLETVGQPATQTSRRRPIRPPCDRPASLLASGEIKSAVDVKNSARDVSRIRTDEERDGGRHVFGGPHPLKGTSSLVAGAFRGCHLPGCPCPHSRGRGCWRLSFGPDRLSQRAPTWTAALERVISTVGRTPGPELGANDHHSGMFCQVGLNGFHRPQRPQNLSRSPSGHRVSWRGPVPGCTRRDSARARRCPVHPRMLAEESHFTHVGAIDLHRQRIVARSRTRRRSSRRA